MKATCSRIRNGETVSPSALLDDLAIHFPLINQLAETPQDPEWHAEGNVRVHTEMVIAEASAIIDSSEGQGLSADERLVLVLGAALHDIGKALTTREAEIDGKTRIISPRHPERGRSYLAPRIPLLELPWEICDAILGLVGYHHAPGKMVVRGEGPRHFSKLARAVNLPLVYLLELADLRGRILSSDTDDRDGFGMMDLFRQSAGDFGLWDKPDPYSDWRSQIADAVDTTDEAQYVFGKAVRDFEDGKIFTPEEAIARTYEWRSDHPEVVVMCGVSGSGKSTWLSKNCVDYEQICLDEIRERLTGKAHDQKMNGQVLQTAKAELRQHLRDKKRIVWDATTIRKDGRSMVIDLAHDYHASSKIVAIACPPNEIKKQNKGRARQVADNVIARQFERLQWPEVWEAEAVSCTLTRPN